MKFLDDVYVIDGAGLSVGGTEQTITVGAVAWPVVLTVHNEADGDFMLGLHKHSDSVSVGAAVELARSRGSEGSESAVQSDDKLGHLGFYGHDGTDYGQAARIDVYVDGAPSSTSMPGRIQMATSPAGTQTPTARLIIYSDGEVALGTNCWLDFDEQSAPSTPASGRVILYPKSDGLLYSKDDAGTERALGASTDYVLLQDQKSAGTAGGTFTSGAWRTRDLNTEVADTGGHCSLSSNQFTLAAGTYRIKAHAPAYACSLNQLKLRNTSDGTDTVIGGGEYAEPTYFNQAQAMLEGRFTIASSKTFELQHRCLTTRATDGFGNAGNFGVTEVYAVVELWKEKGA